jgi:hypothetical protein
MSNMSASATAATDAAKKTVEADRPRSDEAESARNCRERQRELNAVLSVRAEEAVVRVDGHDRYRHVGRQGKRRERRQQTETDKKTAGELNEPREHRQPRTGGQPHRLKVIRRACEAKPPNNF